MLVLSPPLHRALSVVRRLQSAAPATRRDLFVNPRAHLRDTLGDEDETLIENVFRDTPAYSERVRGLGLWPLTGLAGRTERDRSVRPPCRAPPE
jgi:hypothetical protein